MSPFWIIFLCFVWISNGAPLAKRLVDLTHVFDETTQHLEGFKGFRIENLFNGTVENLDRIWLQFEDYAASVHIGTHMDAPAHVVKGGNTVDDISPSDFIAAAAVIDVTTKAEQNPDTEVTPDDLLNWESSTGHTLNDTIVLLRSGWGQKWNNKTAFFGIDESDASKLHYPRFSAETCEWLVSHRTVKGIGTEAMSPDIRGSVAPFYPCHQTILGHGLFILENVANVDELSISGAKLYVFPMKIGKGSGAPTRIVAELP